MRLSKTLFVIFVISIALLGCGGGGGDGGGGFIPTGKIIAVAERSGSNVEIKVGGIVGAAPPGSTVEVTNLNTGETQTTTAEADGSFDPTDPTFRGSTSDTFVVSINGRIVSDDPIGVTLISQAVTRRIKSFRSSPTAIEIRGNRAYVLLFSNSIQIFDLDEDPPQRIGDIDLPPGSDPIAIAFLDDTRAYVTNLIGQSVAVVNVETKECETIIAREEGNFPFCENVIVEPGAFEDPSGVATAPNGKVYVTNNNLDDFFDPAGDGFITIIDSETNRVVDFIDANGTNTGGDSGGITPINDKLYVINAGDVDFDANGEPLCDFKFPPSIDVVDTESDKIVNTIDIELDPENPTICFPNRIEPTPDLSFGYMGLGNVGALLKIDLVNDTVVNGPIDPIIITPLDVINFTADVEITNDGLGFTTLLNTDQIAVFDTATDEVNPFPFVAPFPVGRKADNPGSQFLEGPQFLSIRSDGDFPDIFFVTVANRTSLGSINTALILPHGN